MHHDNCDHCQRGFAYGLKDIRPIPRGTAVTIICPSCGVANVRELQPARESAMIAPAIERTVLPQPQLLQQQILEPTPARALNVKRTSKKPVLKKKKS